MSSKEPFKILFHMQRHSYTFMNASFWLPLVRTVTAISLPHVVICLIVPNAGNNELSLRYLYPML